MRLDGAGQLLGAAGLLDELGRLHGMLDLVLELLPVKVVKKADLAPELHVCRVVLLRIVAHEALEGLAVGNVERVLVVLLQQVEGLVAREAGLERRGVGAGGGSLVGGTVLGVVGQRVHGGGGIVGGLGQLGGNVGAGDDLGLHLREEKDVADGRGVAEQHDHAVDAVADAARGGHAVLEGAHVVVVVAHGLIVAEALGRDLLGKAAGLVDGVVELGEGVGVLVAADDQLKAVGQARVVVLALGEGADLLGVVADEGRVDQRGLAQLVVKLKDQLAGAPVLLPLDAVLLADLAQALDGGVHVHVLAAGAGGHLGEGQGLPGAGHVDGLALVGDDLVALLAAADLAGDGLEEALGELLHAVQVGVGAVGLH